MEPGSGEVTRLLAAAREGDSACQERVVELIYPELRRIARRHMGTERAGHTLQPTALVNEAWLRLSRQDKDWQNRIHFFAVAAQVMRQILVDYARQHRAGRRNNGQPHLNLEDVPLISEIKSEKLLALDEALSRLQQWDARQSRVVELRFFGGLTEEEISQVLGVSARTVKRDWSIARAWLYAEIGK